MSSSSTATVWFGGNQQPAPQEPGAQAARRSSGAGAPARSLLSQAVIQHRPAFAHLEINLNDGEEVVADAGTLRWMDGDVKMHTACHTGSCCDAFYRTCAGESCCQNKFTGPGTIALGYDLPGDMLPFAVGPGSGWIISSGSFVAGTPNLNISGKFAGCAVCTCGGEGAFLTHVTADDPALFFAGDYGAIQRHEIPAGKTLAISSGLFFAAPDSIDIKIGMAASCKTCLCGDQGFVMKIAGPSVIYTQNRDPGVINALLSPSLVKLVVEVVKEAQKQQGGGGGGQGGGQ